MDFTSDKLGRQKFADLLIDYAISLASAHSSPAGRVIAVDAPWGSGKSWIAKQLPEHTKQNPRVGDCIYIDAFQFDYHQDPFAVVTSAILDTSKNHGVKASSLKQAAIQVLKVSLPTIGKGLIRVGGKVVGTDINEIFDAAVDAGSEASEKAIEHMLETFNQTKATTETFKNKLSELASANPDSGPLIIVIDELDRCRPSYALEMLERVKHLFDVPNVVFIFFIHSPALLSAINKTYGEEILASEYLKKFISVTISLPVAEKSNYQYRDRSSFITKFIESTRGPTNCHLETEFRSALIEFGPIFNVSFRDIESAFLLRQLTPKKESFHQGILGYVMLLKLKEPKQFISLRNYEHFFTELERLNGIPKNVREVSDTLRDMFTYASQPEAYVEAEQKLQRSDERALPSHAAKDCLEEFQRVIVSLSLEYVRI